ncbi:MULTISPECIES: transcription termination factor NusA [Streptococcus]|jgi:transcription termination factor nusA|uniref:Transcription termination/antitermination protein NusA n=1 Tax=Streptococcus gordonii (strain Challis / ATCC 35105 / BCRC 15272 / CH1 / DL1 / V288) TaxID=467705 RepID=A8AVP9_STRGC|nr:MULTISPECIES: transcription termination factor NusA [Streptococcus]ABV11175.1 transcription termination factor NusA [Streptococcus gordonii str. Challis substr. CH1]MBN2958270.1 transcription termination/antitermination protein NusA [Streptococcus gordonii]MBZ2136786.1 transcription termination factor NusA [Streptococcus gordonii]MDU3102190.1 transcription termination factor NusA [Streptococcus sp.]QGS44892.1 transcription termination/antitermination protein NusA [Streptococcus gordonii]
MSKEMLDAFRILEEDKGIKKEDIIDAVKESLRSAYRRRYGQADSALIDFDEKKGDFHVYTVREVVDEVFDSRLEISLKDALAISSAYELGDKIKFEEAPVEFGRVAAQSAKQTIMEKMRKQTRTITYNTYKEHENEIMSGTVERFDNRFIYVNLGSIEAQLSKQDQIPGEIFASHDRIEVFVYKVEDNPRGVNVFVSRSHPEMIKRLMEQEIPEVYDGTVEIMSVAREAGDRTKVAVRSHNPNVDAIGTIVGRGGANIKKITSKFHPAKYDAKSDRMIPVEENIDVIEWVADPAEFIYNAIAPAEVDQVIFNAEDSKRALVVVPDNKLSLAIGRRGQNVRLAAHLTGYRIDIKSASEFEAMEAANELGGFGEVAEEVVYEDDANLTYTDQAMEEMAAAALATDLEESEVTELD